MKEESFPSNYEQHVSLRLGDRRFTCEIDSLQEIIHEPVLEPCLDGPEILVGILDTARGAFPVLDLLGRPPEECPLCDMAVIVMQYGHHVICLLVDELLDVLEFDKSSALPVIDGANGVDNEFLFGIISINSIDYYMLDLEKIAAAFAGVSRESGNTNIGGIFIQ